MNPKTVKKALKDAIQATRVSRRPPAQTRRHF